MADQGMVAQTETTAPNIATQRAEALERVLISGDLGQLKPDQRVEYYNAVCNSLGLNPLTKPFEYLNLNGKLRFYATKDCTEQLRYRDHVSVRIVAREVLDGDVFAVTARAVCPDGREDESIGAVNIASLKGEAKANALMKAETKAKRRVTLSICGLGMLDELETDSISGAQRYGGDAIEGSREAQSAVLNRKLIEAGMPPEEAQAEADKKLASGKKLRSDSATWQSLFYPAMDKMKSELGNDRYYAILGREGVENKRQLAERGHAEAQRVYKLLSDELQSLRLGVSVEDLSEPATPAQRKHLVDTIHEKNKQAAKDADQARQQAETESAADPEPANVT